MTVIIWYVLSKGISMTFCPSYLPLGKNGEHYGWWFLHYDLIVTSIITWRGASIHAFISITSQSHLAMRNYFVCFEIISYVKSIPYVLFSKNSIESWAFKLFIFKRRYGKSRVVDSYVITMENTKMYLSINRFRHGLCKRWLYSINVI